MIRSCLLRSAVFASLLVPAACAGPNGPYHNSFIVLASTPSTYVVELYGALLINGPLGGKAQRYQAAVEAADKHCAQYGKTARFVAETDGSYGDRRRVSFACQ